jgi:hypothetical protein
MKRIAGDVKNYLEKDAGKNMEFMKYFEMCFKLSAGFSRDAAAF